MTADSLRCGCRGGAFLLTKLTNRPGGFAAFELSNDRKWREGARRRGVRDRLAAAVGRAPRGVTDDAWLGSHVEIDDVRRVAAESGMTLERIVGEGTEFCAILLRRGTSG